MLRTEAGTAIKSLLNVEYPEFKNSILQTRENADNNDYVDKRASYNCKVGTGGIFQLPGGDRCIGRIISEKKINTNGTEIYAKYLELYKVVTKSLNSTTFNNNSSYHSSITFPLFFTDRYDNILLEPYEKILFNDTLLFVEHLDFDTLLSPSKRRFLNVHKFGTLWLMLRYHRDGQF